MPRTRPMVTPSISTDEIADVTEIVESMTARGTSWERTRRGAECEAELRAALDAYHDAENGEYAALRAKAEPTAGPGALPWEGERPTQLSPSALASAYVHPAVSEQRIEAANAYLDAVRAWADRIRAMAQGAEGRGETSHMRKQIIALWEAWEDAGRTTAGRVDVLQARIRNAFEATAGNLRGRRMLTDCLTGMRCDAKAARMLCGLDFNVFAHAQSEARGLLDIVSEQVTYIPTNGQGVRDVCGDMADLVDMVAPWAPAEPASGAES